MTTPDFDKAATAAAETILKYHVSAAPVMPLPILKKMPGVIVLSFAELAEKVGVGRESVLSTFDTGNRDVVTTVSEVNGKLRYIVTYNQRMPFYMLQRSLARELGHIVLRHDGSRPEDIRSEEAVCFARHLLCPRPLIQALVDANVPLTMETVGNITGCHERCMRGIRRTPSAHVPAELNRAVKEQFAEYIANFLDCRFAFPDEDDSPLADFGTYMDGYEE